MKNQNQHIGSSLDEFLQEEGMLEESRAMVRRELLSRNIQPRGSIRRDEHEQGAPSGQ